MNRLLPTTVSLALVLVASLVATPACGKTDSDSSETNNHSKTDNKVNAEKTTQTADKAASKILNASNAHVPTKPTGSADKLADKQRATARSKSTDNTASVKAPSALKPARKEREPNKRASSSSKVASSPSSAPKAASAKPVWLTGEKLARARAKKLKRKILIDFGASWCLPCEQYEKITFADKKVSAKLATMVLLKFDVSANSDADKALQQRFGVKTLPALLVLSPSGKEQKRITKFLKPAAFLTALGN